MGINPQNHTTDMKSMVNSKGSLILKSHTKKRWLPLRKQRVSAGGHTTGRDRPRGVLTNRRPSHLEESRRSSNAIKRRVKALKELIPNTESMGLDGLFRETADYILALQTRVRVMQTLVNVLANDV